MQLTTIPLAALRSPKGNPRRTLDTAQIASLARSIHADGVLQNLVVRPEGDDGFRVISGKRRYLALQLLKKEGTIDGSYPVPVEIKEDLSDTDALRIATVENVQREQLNPMDEAEAFAKLLQSGGTIDAIVDKTGLSAQTIKRRVSLATLCTDAKKLLRAGTIGLGIAEAMTLGSQAQQRSLLESLDSEEPPDAEDIREMLLGQKPNVAMAIFPREQYAGTMTTDLFSDDETTYFDDVESFLALQKAAVEALAEEYRTKAAWVDMLNLYTVPWWQYRQVEGEEQGGVVINLHPSGTVEVREGLARHEVKQEVVHAVGQTPVARPVRERPAFSADLIRYVVKHKSVVVQAALLRNPRKAKEISALLLLLGAWLDGRVRLSTHSCLSLMSEPVRPRACVEIENITSGLADALGFQASAENGRGTEDGLSHLLAGGDTHDLYEAIGKLSDEELDRLTILLPVLCFGQQEPDALDVGKSLFNRVAIELGINMREWWVPDTTFLSGIRRDDLDKVALEVGAADRIHGLGSRSKGELVDELAKHFATAAADASDDEALRRAREWLPAILKFPGAEKLTDAN
jgi:ParB family transcriptional regulator, chromosome partitioning protein